MGEEHPGAGVGRFAFDQELVDVWRVAKSLAIAVDQPKPEAGDYDPFGIQGRDAECGRKRGLGVGAAVELGEQAEFDGSE